MTDRPLVCGCKSRVLEPDILVPCRGWTATYQFRTPRALWEEAVQEPVHSHNPVPRRAWRTSFVQGRTRSPLQGTLWCEAERDHSKRGDVRQQASQCSIRAWCDLAIVKECFPASESRVHEAAMSALRLFRLSRHMRAGLFPSGGFWSLGTCKRLKTCSTTVRVRGPRRWLRPRFNGLSGLCGRLTVCPVERHLINLTVALLSVQV
jgi:hypothetical protein